MENQPKPSLKDQNPEKIAKELLESIAKDVNLYVSDNYSLKFEEYLPLVTERIKKFQTANPDFVFDDNIIEQFAIGEEKETKDLYGHLNGYSEICEQLTPFFWLE